MYCKRSILPGKMDKYKSDWTVYSNHAFKDSPGVKVVASFVDKTAADKVLQIFWFDTAEDFYVQPIQGTSVTDSLKDAYDPTGENTCQVFGGWTDVMVDITKNMHGGGVFGQDVHFVFKPTLVGFIKSSASGIEGPPIFFFSRRQVKPGMLAQFAAGFGKACDSWFYDVPGLLAGIDFVATEDDTTVWDLRAMANYNDGFLTHVTQKIMGILVANMVPYVSVTTPYMDAFAISSGDESEKMIALNPGNGMYTHYKWDVDLIGPMPDMNKAYNTF